MAVSPCSDMHNFSRIDYLVLIGRIFKDGISAQSYCPIQIDGALSKRLSIWRILT